MGNWLQDFIWGEDWENSARTFRDGKVETAVQRKSRERQEKTASVIASQDPFGAKGDLQKAEASLTRLGSNKESFNRERIEGQMREFGLYLNEYESRGLDDLSKIYGQMLQRLSSQAMIGTGKVMANVNLYDMLSAR